MVSYPIRLTLTNLMESVNDWTVSIENKVHNRVAYIYFSRAFDSVSHAKLLHKLKAYGIDGIPLCWISDILSERLHSTRVGNVLLHSKRRCTKKLLGRCKTVYRSKIQW